MLKNLVNAVVSTLETKLCGVLYFKTFALSLRSRRQHKAWGVSPRRKVVKRSAAHEVGDSCRPFHGLDIAPNLTRGSAFGSTPGFMLPPAPRAWPNIKKPSLQSTYAPRTAPKSMACYRFQCS